MKNEIKSGTILISKPFMEDSRFEKTVILIVESSKEGTMGFILNKSTNSSKVQGFLFWHVDNTNGRFSIDAPYNNTIYWDFGGCWAPRGYPQI